MTSLLRSIFRHCLVATLALTGTAALFLLPTACRNASGPGSASDEVVADAALFRNLPREPWIDPPNMSEQWFPMYVGASPRELMLDLPKASRPRLPDSLKALGEYQAKKILSTLRLERAEFQAWPTEDWNGQFNWVFARWRPSPGAAWQWLTESDNWRGNFSQVEGAASDDR